MNQIGRASLVCLLAAAACSGSDSTAGLRPGNPTEARPETHATRPAVRNRPLLVRTIPFTVYTHCGIDIVSVDADWYQAEPPINDGNGNRPAGWDTPTDTGELAIYDDGTAKFMSHAGHVATFVKLPEKPTLTGCD